MSDYTTHADLGGRADGHGRVVPESEGEVFHEAWQARAMALTVAMGATGAWNLDMSRAARETLPDYRRLGYYEIWLGALHKLLHERGLVAADEIAAARALHAPPRPLLRVLAGADVASVLARGASTERAATCAARFAVGQPVRTRAHRVPHHTRLPTYAQGKRGVIERVHGMHVYADAHAQGQGEQPQWLYTVVFDGAALWGDAAPGLRVSVDAWEPYLDAAA